MFSGLDQAKKRLEVSVSRNSPQACYVPLLSPNPLQSLASWSRPPRDSHGLPQDKSNPPTYLLLHCIFPDSNTFKTYTTPATPKCHQKLEMRQEVHAYLFYVTAINKVQYFTSYCQRKISGFWFPLLCNCSGVISNMTSTNPQPHQLV